jgi:nucleoid DNA-binding protein
MAADNKALTESQVVKMISEHAELTKKDVVAVFDALRDVVQGQMKKKGAGKVKVPKLGVIIRRIKKPATKARRGINPRTGEEVMIAAKPARQVIKATALKALKGMLEA